MLHGHRRRRRRRFRSCFKLLRSQHRNVSCTLRCCEWLGYHEQRALCEPVYALVYVCCVWVMVQDHGMGYFCILEDCSRKCVKNASSTKKKEKKIE